MCVCLCLAVCVVVFLLFLFMGFWKVSRRLNRRIMLYGVCVMCFVALRLLYYPLMFFFYLIYNKEIKYLGTVSYAISILFYVFEFFNSTNIKDIFLKTAFEFCDLNSGHSENDVFMLRFWFKNLKCKNIFKKIINF